MSGKGSSRRPQEAPDEQVKENWERIFGSKDNGSGSAKDGNESIGAELVS